MGDVIMEKSAEDLRKEIDELNRQQREITERLRDPRGLRKSGPAGAGIRGGVAGVVPQRLLGRGGAGRGAIRRQGDAIDAEEQPPTKKRVLSSVVKVAGDEEGVEADEKPDEAVEPEEKEKEKDEERFDGEEEQKGPFLQRGGYGSGRREFRVGDKSFPEQENEPVEPAPRVIPTISDPNVAKRNRRMFGALLGTLEKFKQEDKKLSGSEAFTRRSEQQKRAEQRAQEESDRLRQQEREQIAKKRRRDLVLRARLAAKAEEKQLEVLFIQWTEHQTKLCSHLRTKAEPGIFYLPSKPSEETDKLLEARKEDLNVWKGERRAELKEYQRQSTEAHLAKVEADIERWQANQQGNNNRNATDNAMEDHLDGAGAGDEVAGRGKHGWRRGRESANGEDDTGDDDNGEEDAAAGADEEEAKVPDKEEEEEVGVKAVSVEIGAKGSADVVDIQEARKDSVDGALKNVMDYGSAEEDMEEG